ncbi:hypothetical protein GW17_00001717 [Ensete ventricosum]|nr:hypothetical protein GW17_00001717 [Ensete ventricosum]
MNIYNMFLAARFATSTCTARYGRYIPVRQVTGTRTARYRAVPSKIDRRRPIEKEIDRRRSIEREIDRRRLIEEKKGKKKKRKRKKKKRRRKNTSPACHRRPRLPARRRRPRVAVAARGSPARGRRPRIAYTRSPPAGRPWPLFLPREETECLPARGDRSRRLHTARYGSCTDTDNMSVHWYGPNMIIASLLTGLPDSILDWTRDVDSGLSNDNYSDQVFSRKHWRLVRCQNGETFIPCSGSLIGALHNTTNYNLKDHDLNHLILFYGFVFVFFQDFAFLRSL